MIITDEKILRTQCQDVLPEEVGEIVSLLERELQNSARLGNPGVGLAAIQCGIAKNVAIVRAGNDYSINLVNCKIAHSYHPSLFRQEGCLSVPNKTEDTMRYQEIHVVNNLVYPHAFVAMGLLSVIVNHEIDHLNGVIFTDHLAPKIIQATSKKVKPNDPCICGSKVKYKRCCGKA